MNIMYMFTRNGFPHVLYTQTHTHRQLRKQLHDFLHIIKLDLMTGVTLGLHVSKYRQQLSI